MMTAKDSSSAWLGTDDGIMFHTINGGVNWVKQADFRPYSFFDGIAFSAKYPNIGYAFADSASGNNYYGVIVLKTTDWGLTWVHMNYSVPGYTGAETCISIVDSDCVWLGLLPSTGDTSKIMNTTNGGLDWQLRNAPGGTEGPVHVQFSDDKMTGVYINGQGIQNAHIYRTTNGGVTWTVVFSFNGLLPSNETNIVWMSGTSNVYAQNSGSDGIFRSTDNGSTWHNINNVNSFYLLGAVKLNASTIYLSGKHEPSDSVYKMIDTSRIFGIENIGTSLPNKYHLSQNYPNPFNPVTKIEFTIPKKSYVRLDIYDILGKEKEALVNQELNPSEYEITFDGSNYASGVYFYRIEAGKFVQSKKMVIVR